MKIKQLFVFVTLFFTASCSKITGPTNSSTVFFNYLTTFRQISTSSVSSTQNNFFFVWANSQVQERLTQFINYNVTSYKISYRTVSSIGTNIIASGLIIVPDAQEPSIVSYQRGTITAENQVPSLASLANPEFSFVMKPIASAGFIVVVADYEGYGDTDFLMPPYMHVHSNSRVAIDMLNAAIEFLDYKDIPYRNLLTIAGLSEGAGYAIKMGNLISDTHFDRFFERIDIHAAAGAYHISAFSDSLLSSNREFNQISTYLRVIESFNSLYGINRPWSHYIASEYVELVEQENTRDIPRNPSSLFNTSFIENYLSRHETETNLINAFMDNNVHDLIIRYPVYLYHSRDDEFVPFFNALSAYNSLNSPVIRLVEYENINHTQTAAFFVADFLEIKISELELIATTTF